MKKPRNISNECMDQIVQWVRAYCPCSLEAPEGREFIRGLFFICEEDVRRAIQEERQKRIEAARCLRTFEQN